MTFAEVFELSGNLSRIMCMASAMVLAALALYRDANGDESKATNLIAFACFFAIMAK